MKRKFKEIYAYCVLIDNGTTYRDGTISITISEGFDEYIKLFSDIRDSISKFIGTKDFVVINLTKLCILEQK